ncbi:MAG: helix-turn-helix domain-containing protein [Betaproteobacteria bacterium]|nr:helix-turn-helix domain-containing protein [Betaproteobacteria bacterium]
MQLIGSPDDQLFGNIRQPLFGSSVAKSIGSRLKEAREKLGMDQVRFAEELGIPRNSLHRYETDDQVPGGKVLAKLADLGVDIVYILRGGNSLSVEITTTEMRLIHDYRMSHKDVKKGIKALLASTAVRDDDEGVDLSETAASEDSDGQRSVESEQKKKVRRKNKP